MMAKNGMQVLQGVLDKKYDVLFEVSSGTFGQIYKAVACDDEKKEVAIKALYREHNSTQELDNEITILKFLSDLDKEHQYMVHLLDVYETDSWVYLVLEYLPMDLWSVLQTNVILTEKQAKPIMVGIMQALQFCHNANIIHRDIKPENIMMDEKDHPKLIDFGFAVQNVSAGGTKGTLEYLAPEVISSATTGNMYNYRADLWSLGILFYEMLIGSTPFQSKSFEGATARIMRAQFNWPADIILSKEIKQIIESLLKKVPTQRPTLQELLNHKYFATAVQTPLKSPQCQTQ